MYQSAVFVYFEYLSYYYLVCLGKDLYNIDISNVSYRVMSDFLMPYHEARRSVLVFGLCFTDLTSSHI